MFDMQPGDKVQANLGGTIGTVKGEIVSAEGYLGGVKLIVLLETGGYAELDPWDVFPLVDPIEGKE